jgi:hypothetical protein
MKRILIMFVLPCLFIQMAGMVRTAAQEKKDDLKKEKHIRIVTIKDGVKEVTDTVIVGDNQGLGFTGKDKKFRWVAEECDSLSGFQEFDVNDEELEKIIMMKKRHAGDPVIIRRFESVGDSGKKVTVLIKKSDTGEGDEDVVYLSGDGKKVHRFITAPLRHNVPGIPPVPPLRFSMKQRNVIDLSDPGIISYKKKKMSGGKEKITVIRQEPEAGDIEHAGVLSEPDMEVLRKMNGPKIVRELEMVKRTPGNSGEKKVEIKTIPEPENK